MTPIIKLNNEYTYTSAMNDLGWERSTGAQRQRQMSALLESFEYHHPISAKTGKVKTKSYVFTKQLKEPVLEDGRCRNGRTSELLSCEVGILVNYAISNYSLTEPVKCANGNTEYRLFTTDVYRAFGLEPYALLNRMDYSSVDRIVQMIFEGIVIDAVRNNSTARLKRICGKTGGALKNGLVQKKIKAKDPKYGYVEADTYLDEYQAEFDAYMDDDLIGLYEVGEISRKGMYHSVDKVVMDRLRKKTGNTALYKANVIQMDADRYGARRWDSIFNVSRYLGAVNQFIRVVLRSIDRTVAKRREDPYAYSISLTDAQVNQLQKCVDSFRGLIVEELGGGSLSMIPPDCYDSKFDYYGIDESECNQIVISSLADRFSSISGSKSNALVEAGATASDIDALSNELGLDVDCLETFFEMYRGLFSKKKYEEIREERDGDISFERDSEYSFADYIEEAVTGQESLYTWAVWKRAKTLEQEGYPFDMALRINLVDEILSTEDMYNTLLTREGWTQL